MYNVHVKGRLTLVHKKSRTMFSSTCTKGERSQKLAIAGRSEFELMTETSGTVRDETKWIWDNNIHVYKKAIILIVYTVEYTRKCGYMTD